MGFLTTFTIYNDGIDFIENNKEKFADIIIEATKSHEKKQYPLGYHANLITAQIPVHSHCSKLYFCGGNTVLDLDNLETLKKIKNSNPKYFKSIISTLDYNLKLIESL